MHVVSLKIREFFSARPKILQMLEAMLAQDSLSRVTDLTPRRQTPPGSGVPGSSGDGSSGKVALTRRGQRMAAKPFEHDAVRLLRCLFEHRVAYTRQHD